MYNSMIGDDMQQLGIKGKGWYGYRQRIFQLPALYKSTKLR